MYYKRRKTRERNRCISLNLLVVDYEFDAHMIGVSQLRPRQAWGGLGGGLGFILVGLVVDASLAAWAACSAA